MTNPVTFETGDTVICVNSEGVREHFKDRHHYVIDEVIDFPNGALVSFFGIDGLMFASHRFEHAINAVPVAASPPSPVAKRDVYAYLADSITEYASDPPDSEADSGYLECLRDTMEFVFGLVPVTHVEFVAKGVEHG